VAAAGNFINYLRQWRRRRLENLKIFSVIGGGGSADRLTPLLTTVHLIAERTVIVFTRRHNYY
jgi:hypothetical protein